MTQDDMHNEMTAIDYINMLEPTHSRMSCDEGESHNAAFKLDGVYYNYCNRCTLWKIMELGEDND